MAQPEPLPASIEQITANYIAHMRKVQLVAVLDAYPITGGSARVHHGRMGRDGSRSPSA